MSGTWVLGNGRNLIKAQAGGGNWRADEGVQDKERAQVSLILG